jgi:hypothetical protein
MNRTIRRERPVLFIGVVIFKMTQVALIIDLELLGGFGTLVDRAPHCLILTRMFIVPVIVVIFGSARRVRGENQSLKLARVEYFRVCDGHTSILRNMKGSQAPCDRSGEYPPV